MGIILGAIICDKVSFPKRRPGRKGRSFTRFLPMKALLNPQDRPKREGWKMSDGEKKASEEKKLELRLNPILLGKRGLSPHDDAAAQRWPSLYQLLMPVYDAQKRLCREAGAISLRIEGTTFRITLVCPSEGVSTSVLVHDLSDPLGALEGHVGRPDCPWLEVWETTKKAKQRIKDVLGS